MNTGGVVSGQQRLCIMGVVYNVHTIPYMAYNGGDEY